VVVSGGEDATVRAWDLHSGESWGVFRGHDCRVRSIILIVELDLIVSGGSDSTIRLWDMRHGTPRGVLRGHTSSITALAFFAGSGWLFSASSDATVRIWDIATQRCLRTLEHPEPIVDLAAFGDGKQVLFADKAGTMKIWRPLVGSPGPFLVARPRPQVALSDNQSRVRSLRQNAQAAITRGAFGEAIRLIDEAREIEGYEHSLPLLDLRNNCIQHLDKTTIGEVFDRYVWRDHRGRVHGIVPIGSKVASAAEDGCIILWNLATGEPEARLAEHTGEVRALAASDDGLHLASGGDDGMLRSLSLANEMSISGRGHYKTIYALAYSTDGRTVASTGQDGTLRIWNATTLECQQVLRMGTKQAPRLTDIMSRTQLSIAIPPNARTLISGGSDGKLRVWNRDTGELSNVYEQEGLHHVRELLLLPGGEHVIVGGDRVEGPVSQWVHHTGFRLIRISDGHCLEHREGIYPHALSHDGKLLAAVAGAEIGIYSTDGFSLLGKIPGRGDTVTAATFSRDAHFLFIGRSDGSIHVIELVWNHALEKTNG
jgi:WD40 repeat protein